MIRQSWTHSNRVSLFLLAALLLAGQSLYAKDPPVPQKYAHWLNAEVNYLITSDERSLFLNLKSDSERDTFITGFWRARNPDPNGQSDAFKDEHYRRLAYANEHFGAPGRDDGWSTDRGMAYITLGAPQQRSRYPETRELQPLEIWFYENTNRALPPHFYLVFFKQSAAEEYRLYSPYIDRPQKLVNSTNAINNDPAAIKLIQRDINDEAAHIALSLIPGEPVDFKEATPTLESDTLLNNLRNFRNLPQNRELLSLRRAQERVTSSVFLGDEAEFQSIIFRDKNARMTLSYLLRYRTPDPTLIGRLPGGKTGYSMTMRTTVLTLAGATVYEEEQKLTGILTEAQAQTARGKNFGAEGRLALAPGEYKIVTTLTNDFTHVAVRQESKINVPDPQQTGWGSSGALAFTAQPPVALDNAVLPFTVTGLRFAPRGVQSVAMHPGERLRLLFQLWDRPADVTALQGSKIKVSYVFGTVRAGATPGTDARQESQEVDASNFDPSGIFLTGHTLSTDGEAPGSYRLVITATEEKTGQRAYSTMNLRIVDASEPTDMWTAYDSAPAGVRTDATDDYKRGLCSLALNQKDSARHWLERSVSEDGQYSQAVAKLADLYAADNQFDQLAELSRNSAVTHDLDEKTVLLMANADSKIGDLKRATEILEAELRSHPPSANLYLALAQLYDQAGNPSKAKQYRLQARTF